MEKITKVKIQKSIKKKIFNIITCIVAIIGLIISMISLNENLFQNKRNILPDIVVGSIENVIENYYHTTLDYYQIYSDNINTKMKITNLGNGIAKNIEFIWDEENSENMRSLIENIDIDNLVTFEDKYPILLYNLHYSGGGVNISKTHYKLNIDYLLSEKNTASNEFLYFPYEYIVYLEILSNLSLEYDYDINELMKSIKLYLDITYQDVDNNAYKKTVPIEISFDKVEVKEKDNTVFYLYINNKL